MFSLQRNSLIIAVVCLLIGTTLFVTSYTPSLKDATTVARTYFHGTIEETKRLHLLVPATDANLDFCKFLLSSTITGFPDPIFIGWDGHGEYDGRESHLFKLSEGLAYLNSLPAEQDDDLAVMLDAYDIWLLLRPDVMISRYNKIIAKQAESLKAQGMLGRLNGDIPIENTLLFGADKICWPRSKIDPSCWSPPESPLRQQEYGPDTNSW